MKDKRYWLIKSEPESYSIDHLARDKKTAWNGVRNYQARNFIRDGMQKGDEVLFHHSSCAEPGVYGLARVATAPYPDATQFDSSSDYYDPKAQKEAPTWYLVDVAFVRKFRKPVLLTELRANKSLSSLAVLRKGNRLSVTPVTEKEFEVVTGLSS